MNLEKLTQNEHLRHILIKLIDFKDKKIILQNLQTKDQDFYKEKNIRLKLFSEKKCKAKQQQSNIFKKYRGLKSKVQIYISTEGIFKI